MYFKLGRLEEAVGYFEKFFEAARAVGNMRLLDVARYNLGIARGILRFDEYVNVAVNDLATLLSWKNMRIPFVEI